MRSEEDMPQMPRHRLRRLQSGVSHDRGGDHPTHLASVGGEHLRGRARRVVGGYTIPVEDLIVRVAVRIRRPSRHAFSLLEMMIVVSIIAALSGMGYGILTSTRNRARIQGTRMLVHAVATAINVYSTRTWTVSAPDPSDPTGPRLERLGHLWDMNEPPGGGPNLMQGDGILDGLPGAAAGPTCDGPFWDELIKSGYGGFVAMNPNVPLRKEQMNAQRQVVDAWRHPLHIAFSVKTYGADGFGVWSLGPDGQDGTLDDITSWSGANNE